MAADATTELSGYHYGESGEPAYTAAYLMPAVLGELKSLTWSCEKKRVFEIGSGNGAVASILDQQGYEVIGIDPSADGIRNAKLNFPNLHLKQGSAYDDLAAQYGQFNAVLSLEVVEHVFYPRKFAKSLHDVLKPGGIAIISTPYHGHMKNLLIAIADKWDTHHDRM